MLWVSYGKFSREGIRGLIDNPQNRAGAIQQLMDAYRGKLISYHLLLNGEIDFFIVADIPDECVADLGLVNALLVRGSGAVETITTVPAYRAEDAIPLMQRAQKMTTEETYKSPSAYGYFPREGA
ncbi:GYD domain-containing protein [Desulfococcus sp.]|uniref:GYD domain-containing protein n=1 Tax=Desulfococcus sp. TaxID=2025834 RepID=UPI003593595B